MTRPDPKRCPTCDRSVRLTKAGLIGKHDRSPYHRFTTCSASGQDYEQAWERVYVEGRVAP